MFGSCAGWFNRQIQVTPDGGRYILMAEGNKLSRPFHYRWLMPLLCGVWPNNWVNVTDACALILPFLVYWYAGGGWAGLFVAALAVGFTGVIKFNRQFPVLVDLPAMTVGLASACFWHQGWYAPALALIVVAACIKETTPVFVAVWAWTPWMLVGLLAPAVRHFVRHRETAIDAENEWHLAEVIRGAFAYRKSIGVPTWAYVLPWGAAIVGLAHGSPQLAVVLVLAYAQLVIATDVVRLYQWAWPVVAVAAASAVDVRWYLPLVALHFVNPYRTGGS